MKRNLNCVNCNNNNFLIYDKFYHGKRLKIKKIFICNFCKLKQTDYLPDDLELKSFYNNINTKLLFDNKKKLKIKHQNNFDSFLNFIFNKTKLNKDNKLNFIDIGAGNGKTMLQIKNLTNWNSFGIEPDAVKFKILSFFRLNVFNDLFQNIKNNLKDNYFDLITISQVLEHVKDPLFILKDINRILKKGGYLWLDVPLCNGNYFKSRLNDDVGHLYFFEEKTLKKILKKNNFSIVASGSYGKMINNKRSIASSIKLFIKYYFHRLTPLFVLDINKKISNIIFKKKNVNLDKIFYINEIKINENNYNYEKLFFLVKKEN